MDCAVCSRAPLWDHTYPTKAEVICREAIGLPAETSMFGRRFLFLDVFVDQARYAAAGKATRRLKFRFTFGIAHETPVKRFLSADVIIIVECEFAALAALQIFRHGFLPLRSTDPGR
jgi:hypothetical protein